MEIRSVLIAAIVIAGCGGICILAVRLSTPFLKGLGWLASAFFAGSASVLLISLDGKIPPVFSSDLGNWLTLVAFALVNVAILDFTERQRLSLVSLGLLAIEFVNDFYFSGFPGNHAIGVEASGLVFAAQAIESAYYLIATPKKGLRAPVGYTAIVFLGFAAFNLFRTAMVAWHGMPQDPFAPSRLQFVAVIVYLSTALGVGFGVFWMTHARLRLAHERLAATDPLTGVENRRTFQSICEKECVRSLRSGQTFSLIVADLDHFKRVNDRFGHVAGDSVLCAIAKHIQSRLRASDTLGRWGGEEFVILLPDCSIQAATDAADRLRKSIGSLAIPLPTGEVSLTVSCGVAAYLGREDTVEGVFRRADAALYRAKSAGRNRVNAIQRDQSAEYFFSEQKTKLAL